MDTATPACRATTSTSTPASGVVCGDSLDLESLVTFATPAERRCGPVTDGSPTPGQGTGSAEIDTTVPHSARIWNYWMGGKDNYPVDRAAGDAFVAIYPDIVTMAKQSRQFLIRTVRFLAAEAGIRQFLDIGTGLPTMQNTHEVAQQIAPECRIVYVDNDPMVLAHAEALL